MKILESEGHIDGKIIRFMMVGGKYIQENTFVSAKVWNTL